MTGSTSPYLDFEAVKEFVHSTLKNQSGVPALKPDLSVASNPTRYDASEFYQLRIACARGQVQQNIVPPHLIDTPPKSPLNLKAIPFNFGKVCDYASVYAADQMIRGVPVNDPTHLLAPFLRAAQARGYTFGEDSGRSEYDAAMLVANQLAQADLRPDVAAREADKNPVAFTIPAELQPKGKSGVTLNSTLGASKEAVFARDTAKAITTQRLNPNSISTANIEAFLISSSSCSISQSNDNGFGGTRGSCGATGRSLHNEYMKSRITR